jgi:hypothetical protein
VHALWRTLTLAHCNAGTRRPPPRVSHQWARRAGWDGACFMPIAFGTPPPCENIAHFVVLAHIRTRAHCYAGARRKRRPRHRCAFVRSCVRAWDGPRAFHSGVHLARRHHVKTSLISYCALARDVDVDTDSSKKRTRRAAPKGGSACRPAEVEEEEDAVMADGAGEPRNLTRRDDIASRATFDSDLKNLKGARSDAQSILFILSSPAAMRGATVVFCVQPLRAP